MTVVNLPYSVSNCLVLYVCLDFQYVLKSRCLVCTIFHSVTRKMWLSLEKWDIKGCIHCKLNTSFACGKNMASKSLRAHGLTDMATSLLIPIPLSMFGIILKTSERRFHLSDWAAPLSTGPILSCCHDVGSCYQVTLYKSSNFSAKVTCNF